MHKETMVSLGLHTSGSAIFNYGTVSEAGNIYFLTKNFSKNKFNNVRSYTTLAVGPDYIKSIVLFTGNLLIL